jgi:hypothetical protein
VRKIILLFLPFLLLGQTSPKKDEKPAPKATGLRLPAEAVKVGPAAWRYVDKDGKVWLYRGMVTGLVRMPESASGKNFTGLKVIDKGDTYRFERPAVVGLSVWERKKSELNDDEKAMVEYAKSKAQESKAADKAPENK